MSLTNLVCQKPWAVRTPVVLVGLRKIDGFMKKSDRNLGALIQFVNLPRTAEQNC